MAVVAVDIAVADTAVVDTAVVAQAAYKQVAHIQAERRNNRYPSFLLDRQYIDIQR